MAKTDRDAEYINQDLDKLIGYNLKRAYVLAQADFRRALGSGGLSPRYFAALALVVENPNITQSALARALGVERSGLVAIADELERRAYLNRVSVEGDRRVQALVPTDTGISEYRLALEQVNLHEEKLFSVFTDDEQQQLLGLLKKFRNAEEG